MIDLQDHLVTVLSGDMSDIPGPEARYWASSMAFQSRPEVMHTRFGLFPSALTIQRHGDLVRLPPLRSMPHTSTFPART